MDVCLEEANIWMGLCDFEYAVRCCDRALLLIPHFEKAYRTRAQIWQKMKLFDRAIVDLKVRMTLNITLRFTSCKYIVHIFTI